MRWSLFTGAISGAIAIFLGVAQPGWAAESEKLYAEKCGGCHGSKGEGAPTAPPLHGNPFVAKGKPAEIKKVILQGRSGADKKYLKIPIGMPGGLVSEAEADALVKFLQSDLQK